MHGEAIITRSIDAAVVEDKQGRRWQYHSRSDRHSKVACWAILFDLLETCPLLRAHIAAGKVGFGINHELRDFRQNRKKNLDLVLCAGGPDSAESFADYGRHCGVVLSPQEEAALAGLPVLRRGRVSNVLLALEAKACMTEHIKALPRLHDELSSSFQTVHGDTNGVIAAAYVVINCADSFVSPGRNPQGPRAKKVEVTRHTQPKVSAATLAKVMQIERRSDERGRGFDAMGVSMLRCRNDGSRVEIDPVASATLPAIVTYDSLVHRIAHLYGTKFGAL